MASEAKSLLLPIRETKFTPSVCTHRQYFYRHLCSSIFKSQYIVSELEKARRSLSYNSIDHHTCVLQVRYGRFIVRVRISPKIDLRWKTNKITSILPLCWIRKNKMTNAYQEPMLQMTQTQWLATENKSPNRPYKQHFHFN